MRISLASLNEVVKALKFKSNIWATLVVLLRLSIQLNFRGALACIAQTFCLYRFLLLAAYDINLTNQKPNMREFRRVVLLIS